ncbi:MAG: arsenic efflux protein, partial [Oscillospiraceae bacterium]
FSGEIKDCDCHGHHKKDEGIFLAAVKHTISILFIIFLVSLAISFIVHFIGETVFSGWLSNLGIFQVFIVAIIGFIPNCAASVLLTQLYVSGGITFASAVAGLCTGAGVGLIVLFKSNKNIKENLKIMGLLYLFATIMGLILHFLSFVF